MTEKNINEIMKDMGQRAKIAARKMVLANSDDKKSALLAAADLVEQRMQEILAANQKDMKFGREKGLSSAMIDRLLLDELRVKSIADSLRAIANQDDPVGEVIAEWDRESGLNIKRIRTPLGVIGIIYESRPNVTADAGALCLKSGNACILRGGSESLHSAMVLHSCLVEALNRTGLPEDAIQLVKTRDRAVVGEMLKMVDVIDVIIPRGGKSLVARVQADARVPVFSHLEGICHIYVDKDADVEMARRVILNAKTRRTGICGSAECILVDKAFYDKHGAPFISDLIDAGVEVRADAALSTVPGTIFAKESDWGKEYLDMIIATKIVDDVDGAAMHILEFGSGHTDCIITKNNKTAAVFFAKVDSAIVMRNASTQFADGGEFGLGAEIGIATGKLHARGPIGATQLTSFKYIVEGDGAVRG